MRRIDIETYCSLLLAAALSCARAEAGREQRHGLAQFILRLRARLVRPPRCLLLGEINSGKSTLANLLIGESVVPTSVVANSRFPIHFRYAETASISARSHDGTQATVSWPEIDVLSASHIERIVVELPVDRLKVFEVIDTPGTGNPTRDIASSPRQFANAHIPIWCTVAARSWKESERREWARISVAQKSHALLVVTQADLLPQQTDLAKVVSRLQRETAGEFRAITPLAVPDASQSSVVGSQSDAAGLWTTSGGARFEAELEHALAEVAEQRVRLAQRALRQAFIRRGLLTEAARETLHLGAHTFDDLISTDDVRLGNGSRSASSRVSTRGSGGRGRPNDNTTVFIDGA